jgi:TatD DNase family protein
MQLIDTHAHIYLPQFEKDLIERLSAARDAGVSTILMPAIDSSTHKSMMDLEQEYPHCISMMGLHPCSVNHDLTHELDLVTAHLEERRFIAVGEIGLDFYWDKTHVDEQYQAFHHQIQLALHHGLPVVIHSRESTDECIEVVEQYPGLRGVFHCFSGTYAQAQRIMAAGMMLGIGGVVTFKNSGLDKVVQQAGLSHVVLETDAPYLAPVPHRGKRNEPAYVSLVAQHVAGILGMKVEEIAEITSGNAKKLFKLS